MFGMATAHGLYRTVKKSMCLQSLGCSQVKVPMLCFGIVGVSPRMEGRYVLRPTVRTGATRTSCFASPQKVSLRVAGRVLPSPRISHPKPADGVWVRPGLTKPSSLLPYRRCFLITVAESVFLPRLRPCRPTVLSPRVIPYLARVVLRPEVFNE